MKSKKEARKMRKENVKNQPSLTPRAKNRKTVKIQGFSKKRRNGMTKGQPRSRDESEARVEVVVGVENGNEEVY